VTAHGLVANVTAVQIIGVSRMIIEPAAPYIILGGQLQFKIKYELSNGTFTNVTGATYNGGLPSLGNVTVDSGLFQSLTTGEVTIMAVKGSRSAAAVVKVVEICHHLRRDTDPGLIIPDGGSVTNYAKLTGTGTQLSYNSFDSLGDGWLELTSYDTKYGYGVAYLTDVFTLASPIQIEVDFSSYQFYMDWTLEGTILYLFDANVAYDHGTHFHRSMTYKTAEGKAGLAGGYLAVAVIDWSEGGSGFCGAQSDTLAREFVCLRGPVDGFGGGNAGQRTSETSYPLRKVSDVHRRIVLNKDAGSSPQLVEADGYSAGQGLYLRPPIKPGQ
jgi:hypothetical protein